MLPIDHVWNKREEDPHVSLASKCGGHSSYVCLQTFSEFVCGVEMIPFFVVLHFRKSQDHRLAHSFVIPVQRMDDDDDDPITIQKHRLDKANSLNSARLHPKTAALFQVSKGLPR